jgi:N-terminal domain of anti-restriction factor ArdC
MKIADLYQSVTADIIKDLEAGTAPWTKPWKNGNTGGILPMNAATKQLSALPRRRPLALSCQSNHPLDQIVSPPSVRLGDTRIPLRQPIDDREHQTFRESAAAANQQFAGLGIREELDLLYALLQLVKDGDTALEERASRPATSTPHGLTTSTFSAAACETGSGKPRPWVHGTAFTTGTSARVFCRPAHSSAERPVTMRT